MGIEAKIHLSKLETELIKNKEWILTKQAVINKVYTFFGELNEMYKQILQEDDVFLTRFYKNVNGKISRGENYEGFPYVMLDYPASFSKENILAIRTMFWWGNFFSITLHISGETYRLKENFPQLLIYLRKNNFFVCVNEKEWYHNFEVSNYIPAKELDAQQLEQISARNFFKISKNLKLSKWNEAPQFLEKAFREIIHFAEISFPAGGKVLSPGSPKAGSGL